jgi:NTP pyrophosphatase (non-canonical NTP hydrolase)
MQNPVTYKNYIREAKRTEPDYTNVIGRAVNPKTLRLLHGAMGLVTESAEFLDVMKKYLFYGKLMDVVNMKEECGDIFWYLAILADEMGEANFTNMLQTNIAKLRARYPEKFTEEAAQKRDLLTERKVLETGMPTASNHRATELLPNVQPA